MKCEASYVLLDGFNCVKWTSCDITATTTFLQRIHETESNHPSLSFLLLLFLHILLLLLLFLLCVFAVLPVPNRLELSVLQSSKDKRQATRRAATISRYQ